MPIIHNSVLRLLRECKSFRFLLQIHGSLIVSGLRPHNQLVNAYSLFQRPDFSRTIFDSVRDPGVVLWNSMIRGYTRAGLHREALEFFGYMSEEKGVDPDKYTFTFALKACTDSMDFEEGLRIHDLIAEMGFESDVYIGTALVEMYCEAGDLVSARQVFDRMPVKDIVTWNTMVSVLAQNGCPGEAFRLFRDMHSSYVDIDHVSLYNIIPAVSKLKNNGVNALHAAGQLASLKVGSSIQASLIRFGFCSQTLVGNILVDMYAKCGMIESSEKCFIEIRNKDMVSWNTMLSAYAAHGLARSVVSLFLSMQINELKPDSVSFLSVLSDCRHAGLVQEGKRLFKEMEERHKPEVEHCACMVYLLGKTGLFDEAVEMVREMRVKASVGVWGGALLSSSRIHCNLWLSSAALCQLVKLEPLNPSHCGQNRISREANAVSRTKKIPACSWIQD